MDAIVVIIAAAAIAGGIIGFFIPRKNASVQPESDSNQKSSDEYEKSISELQEKVNYLSAACDRLKKDASDKENEISSLQEKLISGVDNDSAAIIEQIKSNNESQIKKLKQEIEDIEEQLEDAESDVKKAKRALEEKVNENGDLIDQLSAAKKSISDISSELQNTKDNLQETTNQLGLSLASLSFVQEMLNAAPTQNESLSVKWKKISDIADYIFFDVKELVKQYFTPTEKSEYLFGSGLFQWEAIKKKSWIEGKKTIAFIGEFSAGKTSIVNRILSQDTPNATLLPVSAKATTAIPTYIAGGDFTTYQFVSPDGTLKGISEDTFKKVSKEILGKIEGVSNLIKYFVMTYKNPHLTGMSILDTPGFSSGDEEDASRTVRVINECDALFWVFDVNAGTVNRSSLEVIKDNMSRPLFVIINKVDTKSKSDVDAVEKLIKKSFDDEGIKVEGYIRFSSKEPIETLMNVIDSIPNDNSAEQYISLLTDDYFPSLIETCEKNSKKARKELEKSNHECENIREEIIELGQQIQNDSIEAANIPHWETHIFSKDRFEMTQFEGERMINLLEQVANTEIVDLVNMIKEYGDKMQENQNAYSQSNKEQYTLKQFADCKDKLNKLINELNS